MSMKYIALPSREGCRTATCRSILAMEEYVARATGDEHDRFFLWQVEPSVIFGRNQVAAGTR